MTSSNLARRLLHITAAIVSSGAIAAIAACSSPDQARVNAECDCEGCTQAQRQSALQDAAQERQRADAFRCGGAYDSYQSCLNSNSTCINFHFETNKNACGAEKANLCACSQQLC